jgi:hypothetical protein|tara:strand:- start:265 stop:684 length:420 start_codon:yes stop_codon:yes gene_type:complete
MVPYAKIERATGEVLKRKRMSEPVRALHKAEVWLPVERPAPPAFNPDTHKLAEKITQPDLSNLAVDVPADAVRIEGHKKIALTGAEKQARTNAKIAALDHGMARVAEDVAVAMVTAGDVPQAAIDKINARRRLRGQSEI